MVWVRVECAAACVQACVSGVLLHTSSLAWGQVQGAGPWRSSGLVGGQDTGTCERCEKAQEAGVTGSVGRPAQAQPRTCCQECQLQRGTHLPPHGGPHTWGGFLLPFLGAVATPRDASHPGAGEELQQASGAAVWPRLKCCWSPRKEEADRGGLGVGQQGPFAALAAEARVPQPAAEVRGGGLHQC